MESKRGRSMRRAAAVFEILLAFVSAAASAAPSPRNRALIEAELDAALARFPSKVDFTFCVERPDGRSFVRNIGSMTMRSLLESASTSKLVSAVIILRQVEKGRLRLLDKPQDRIEEWPIGNDDPLSDITLAQLLSFTSGLEKEPLVLNAKRVPFEASALAVARENAGKGVVPGKRFFYSGTHLQVAGLMVVRSGGFGDWQAAFDEFRRETGLFASSAYDLPSSLNPRIAGGMHWTAEDYMAFLRKLSRGELLGKAMMEELLRDRTPRKAVSVGYSPVLEAMGEDWHYGFGLWIEELGPGGHEAARISCPGAYGAYPFWDRTKGYFGIVSRQGLLGSFPEGIAIGRSVQSLIVEWLIAE